VAGAGGPILTCGLLLLVPRPQARIAGLIPVLWAAVGGSAAVVLGIPTDWLLAAAGAAVAIYALTPRDRYDTAETGVWPRSGPGAIV
jgi:hypothetical protein